MTPTRTIGKSGRRYVWPEKKPHELEVPSVTTILGNGIPKQALAPWNAKMVAEFAVKHKDEWTGLPDEDAIDLLKRSPYRTTDRSARAGKMVHNALEQHVSGVAHTKPKDKALRNQYEGALQFLRDFKVKASHVEVTIFSREHGYAGTTDIIGSVTIPRGVLGGRAVRGTGIVDYKTGKRIYDEHVVQLTAYAKGDFIAGHDGSETTMPDVDYLIVVRPKKRGGYEAKVYTVEDDVFQVFLAARDVAARDDVLAHAAGGRVLTGPDEDDDE